MARRPREDEPGSWHHVMNRGIARRTLFETERDIRYFLSRLAWAVHAGMIEVHAFAVLTTHFHLLVRSPLGALAAAMQYVQSEYARWFNRSRQRDGSLHRGRYSSKPVRSLAYRHVLVRYIDANPVMAGLSLSPEDYPFGSARWYSRAHGPIWMNREWVEAEVKEVLRVSSFDPRRYVEVFSPTDSARLAPLVETRLRSRFQGEDPLDDLLQAAPDTVLAWMRRKSLLADATEIGLPLACPQDVLAVLEAVCSNLDPSTPRPSQKARPFLTLAKVGLLRHVCGATLAEIGLHAGLTPSGVSRLDRRHRELMEQDESYAVVLSELASAVVQHCHRPGIVKKRV